MKQRNVYTYLGQNGVLTTPIFLEGIYSVKKIELIADQYKILTKDGINFQKSVTIFPQELEEWYEVNL